MRGSIKVASCINIHIRSGCLYSLKDMVQGLNVDFHLIMSFKKASKVPFKSVSHPFISFVPMKPTNKDLSREFEMGFQLFYFYLSPIVMITDSKLQFPQNLAVLLIEKSSFTKLKYRISSSSSAVFWPQLLSNKSPSGTILVTTTTPPSIKVDRNPGFP
ncbi:hypothetical protein EGR_05851 [Echinococcus granulosus]|uniref:Uncharacterized protein n=1 Tax=Echinococcus granulosus TaxID=6210 RepID=W6UD53_ECHGR|nr:hypothetical protein EGR_05851 [Echinococcus granulosus]EUB59250.1 hypothetical protein EGR_05851 [Echinococcus granulosus]